MNSERKRVMNKYPPIWEYAIVAALTVSILCGASLFVGIKICQQYCSEQQALKEQESE